MPQPYEPLTPQVVLGAIVFVICAIGAAATAVIGDPAWVIAFCVVGAIALVGTAVLALMQHRGEAG